MWLGISKGELIQLTMPLPIFRNGLGTEGPSGESSAKAINGRVKINTIPKIKGIPFVTMFLRLIDFYTRMGSVCYNSIDRLRQEKCLDES